MGNGSVLVSGGCGEARQGGSGSKESFKSSTGDLRRKGWRSSSWRERCSCSQSQTQPLPTGGIAGSEATAQSDWNGEETGERSGRQGGAGFVCRAVGSTWGVQAQAERIGQRRPLTGPLDGPRTGQPRAKNSHCESSVQRRRALLEPSCGWRGPSERPLSIVCGTGTCNHGFGPRCSAYMYWRCCVRYISTELKTRTLDFVRVHVLVWRFRRTPPESRTGDFWAQRMRCHRRLQSLAPGTGKESSQGLEKD